MKTKSLKSSIAIAFINASLFGFTACTKSTTTTNSNTPIKTFTGKIELLYDSTAHPDPACMIDCNNGKVYQVSKASPYSSENDTYNDIDIIWYHNYITDDDYLTDVNSYNSTTTNYYNYQWPEAKLFAGWAKHSNVTIIEVNSNLTVAGFDAIKTQTDFTNYVI